LVLQVLFCKTGSQPELKVILLKTGGRQSFVYQTFRFGWSLRERLWQHPFHPSISLFTES